MAKGFIGCEDIFLEDEGYSPGPGPERCEDILFEDERCSPGPGAGPATSTTATLALLEDPDPPPAQLGTVQFVKSVPVESKR